MKYLRVVILISATEVLCGFQNISQEIQSEVGNQILVF